MKDLKQALKEAGYEKIPIDVWKTISFEDMTVIRPIEVEKPGYFIRFSRGDGIPTKYFIDLDFMLSHAQAENIAKALEALMRYITGGREDSMAVLAWDRLGKAAGAAREALEDAE